MPNPDFTGPNFGTAFSEYFKKGTSSTEETLLPPNGFALEGLTQADARETMTKDLGDFSGLVVELFNDPRNTPQELSELSQLIHDLANHFYNRQDYNNPHKSDALLALRTASAIVNPLKGVSTAEKLLESQSNRSD